MKINKYCLFQVTTLVVTWIFQVFTLRIPGRLSEYLALIRRLETINKNRGSVDLVRYIKLVRACFLSYLAGKKLRVKGVRTTKDGIPVILGDLIPKIRKGPSPAMLKIVNTILFSTRALRLGRTIDISPIIDGPKRDPIDIGIYISEFWRDLGYSRQSKSIPKSLNFRSFHLTTKSGPNGPTNALWTCLQDLQALSDKQLTDIGIVGGPRLKERMALILKGLKKIPELGIFLDTKVGTFVRRITSFPDKEMKVRVIAVGDYFSQSALKPLHDYLFRVLKKIPQDCTFNQRAFWDKVKGEEWYESVDLTAATDRFPIKTISKVLLGRLPREYVEAWERLMVETPFSHEGSEIKYSVGNPMGFYSSWASFAVAHHYVIYYCCKRLHIPWKKLKYCLLGDDIIICNKEVAALYKETISRLGVEFSKEKSYSSPHFLEFAKRLFYKGEEISPFPISALGELASKYYLLLSLFLSLEGKGWVPQEGASAAVELFYKIVLSRPSVYSRKLKIKSIVCDAVLKITGGAENAGALLSEAYRKLGFPFVLSDFVAKNILENIAVEQFANSNPASAPNLKKKPKRPCVGLGYLAETLTCLLSGLDKKRVGLGLELIYALPVLNAYGHISQMYMDTNKLALKISSATGAGQWPLLLKTIALPWDDNIFTMRSSHLIAKGASQIVKGIQMRGELLQFYPPEELLWDDPNKLGSL